MSSRGPLATRPIPATGERLPVVGLGTWKTFDVGPSAFERARLLEVLALFAERGARLVDSSPMYGRSETVVGDLASALKIRPSLFLATKVWTTGREAGVAQMNESFARLGTERVDLMQVHNLVDVETHLATLAEWKASGRVRYVGITHYTASAHGDLEKALRSHALDFVQVNYSIGDRAAGTRLLPLAADRGVAVLVNRPFEAGGAFRRVKGTPLAGWASELGCASWAQLFLKYVLGHPAVTAAIPATADVAHLLDTLDAGRGPFPDEAQRRRMAAFFDTLS